MGIPSVPARPCPRAGPPPLEAGDRLSRAEFEQRYQAHPEIQKAELIEGTVYMASPVRVEQHGEPHGWIITSLGLYVAATPGVRLAVEATVRLGFDTEAQPDAMLWLGPEQGGRSRITEDDYLEGPPELIVEIAASSAAYDLHAKKQAYHRYGVPEYLAVQVYEQRLDWFAWRAGGYEALPPGKGGRLQSEVFPGLWLQPAALWDRDLARLVAVLQEGLASPEHAAFVARLQTR